MNGLDRENSKLEIGSGSLGLEKGPDGIGGMVLLDFFQDGLGLFGRKRDIDEIDRKSQVFFPLFRSQQFYI